MAELTAEGLRAGALGFSTSRTLNHRSADGKHIPTLRAEEAELTAIAHGMREAGTGWMQIVSDFEDQDGEIGLFRRLAKESSRPVTITPAAVRRPARRLARADDADRRGQRRGAADHRPGALASDQRAAGARAVAEPVHGPAELQAHRPSAVPRAAGPAAPARVPRPHPGRGVRGQPARPAGRALGPHVPAGRSAGLRAHGREQHRRPRGPRRPLARGGRLRPADRRRRQGHPLSAGHQLCRRQPRRGARDDRRAQLADRPRRRRRACRHHVRRDRHQLYADALDARSRPGRAVPGVVGDQAPVGGQCRGDRA